MIADVPRLLEALGIVPNDWGREIWAPCPNPDHKEKQPSWSIHNCPTDPNHGHHYCFGCQFGGGPLDLVAAVIGFTRSAARRWISERGLWLEGAVALEVELQLVGQAASTLRVPRGLRGGPLQTWVTPVRRYVQARGITEEQVSRWDLRYALDGAMDGRVFFPVADEKNRWLGWHARTFCDQEKRYKNASKEDGFDSGAIFGMRWWPWIDFAKTATVVLTEGAIDALACERVGCKFVAALGGSEPTPRQLLKLTQWKQILIATDGDDAGDHVFSTIRHYLGNRVKVKRVAMPRKEETKKKLDAAAIALREPEKLKALIDAAQRA